MSIDTQVYHTLAIVASVFAAAGAVVKAAYKLVNNHLRHIEQNVIANADANTKAIVTAVQTSSVAIVAAISSKK